MLPIKPLELMTQTHWDLITTSVACNVADEYGPTDKGMVDLLGRGGVKLDELKAKYPLV